MTAPVRGNSESDVSSNHLACIIHEHVVNSFLGGTRLPNTATAVWFVSAAGCDEIDWHLAAAQQRFRDRAFPCCGFRHANRDVFRWNDAVLPRRCSQFQRHCRKVAKNGNDCGRCTTMRRTETITRAPSFRRRSRRVQTCALAQLVPAAARRSSCIST